MNEKLVDIEHREELESRRTWMFLVTLLAGALAFAGAIWLVW
jgi:hypothetical protein